MRVNSQEYRNIVTPILTMVVILLFVLGCGATEPPLPSASVPVPSVPTTSPSATPAPPAESPTSVSPAATVPPTSAASTPAVPAPSDGRTITASIAPVSHDLPDYDRDDWRHWNDDDRDCQDARQETLIAESRSAVSYRNADRCRVESGEWFGVYTGESFTDPGDLDVDHMVPLANAHDSGGWAWSRERKADYANDLLYDNHLITVKASANRQKGRKGPEEWRPSRREYWCQYAIDWATIKQNWGLTATQREADALGEMLATCIEPTSLVIVSGTGAATSPSAPPASTATPIPPSVPSSSELLYDPDGPDRNCGDFDTWDDAQAFFLAAGGPNDDPHRLDGDGDGVACNSLRRN